MSPVELSQLRGRRVAYVAQSAAAAFNPSLRLMDQVTEGVRMRRLMSRTAAEAKARDIFRALALPEPDRIGSRFPHHGSGGHLPRLMAAIGPRDRGGRLATPVLLDASLEIRTGSALGIIGESGSGKSTLARVIAGLLPAAAGAMTLDGVALAPSLEGRGREELRRIQIVFQAADTALNPAHSVERILSRPLAFYHRLSRGEQRRRVRRLLDLVKLPMPLVHRLPTDLSGGQQQRGNLAPPLAAEPALILC